MANIIAVVWDFDKTLVNGYMQDPIFKKYGVDSGNFWKEVNALPKKYMDEQKVRVNPDTIYLNHFLRYTREEKFKGLNNAALREYGKELCFYAGIPDIFEKTQKLISDNLSYREYDIKVEHYIISTGMTEVIKGSSVMPFVEAVWGCEFIEDEDSEGNRVISEIGYTIDNTSKTRALFEINKGVLHRDGIEVNTKINEELRRVHFQDMIYIADGPSDIPAFSVVDKNGGATFAIYPKSDRIALHQVEQMRMDGRIDMYAEADYSDGTTAFLWLINKIEDFANRIRETEKARISHSISDTPKHLV